MDSVTGSDVADLARYTIDDRTNGITKFKMCGATSKKAGILSSDHPYRPETACRWLIRGPPGIYTSSLDLSRLCV